MNLRWFGAIKMPNLLFLLLLLISTTVVEAWTKSRRALSYFLAGGREITPEGSTKSSKHKKKET